MEAARDEIVRFCQEYLKVEKFEDYCVNGLQVEGPRRISRIVTGVSLSGRLLAAVVKAQAQMLIVHHGIFRDQIVQPPSIKGVIRARLKELLQNDINLCGFHLPLDAHPEIGNNISICRVLNIKKCKVFDVGFIGVLPRAVPLNKWVSDVERRLGTRCMVLPGGKDRVKRVAVISGGASPEYEKAASLGADTFLCGDVRENIVRGVEEIGINLVNAGHYNTEKLGVQNLGTLLSKKFKIAVEFVDVPCSI